MNMMQAALRYAASGKPVFPCNPENKRPYTGHGFKDASTDSRMIEQWWAENPAAMVGMPTGPASGLWAVDCDGVEGVERFAALCAAHGYTPETAVQDTPSGGCHYFFAWPDAVSIPNSASKLADKVDVRGAGGYVIVAPSRRADGRAYVWRAGGTKPAPAPAWLVELATVQKQRAEQIEAPCHIGAAVPSCELHPYIKKVFEEESARLARASQGERDETLFPVSCRIMELVAGSLLPYEVAKAEILRACQINGLDKDRSNGGERKILSTIDRAYEKAKLNPATIPQAEQRRPIRRAQGQASGNLSTEAADNQTEGIDILPPPPVVPLDAFPVAVRGLISESAEAFTVSPQIPAACLLSIVSALVGRTRAIEAKAGWYEHANTWIVLVAPSGEGKSPTARAFLRPIEEMEVRLFQKWKEDYEAYTLALSDFNKAKREERGEPPAAPQRTQFYVNDATLESLADALDQNPRGVLWQTDELAGMLADFDKYNASGKGGSTKARLLSSYDCGAWKSNRRDVARNLLIPAACVSIFGGIQPGMMPRVFDGADKDSGFLPRFMFIRAEREEPALWSEKTLSNKSQILLRQISEHLAGFKLHTPDTGGTEPYVVPLTKEAKAAYVEWYNALALEGWAALNEDASDSLCQKLKSHALRLCLLLHCLDAALDGTDGLNPVPEDTMRRALLLVDWVKAHQAQVWKMFSGNGNAKTARAGSPLERAIMEGVVADAERITADGGVIANSRLVELVAGRLPYPVKPEQIGKAAGVIGLEPCYIGSNRARRIPPEKIDAFKTTVGTVGTVGEPTGARAYSTDSSIMEPSVPSVKSPHMASSADSTDSWENNRRCPQSHEYQGQPTVPTVPTVDKTEGGRNGPSEYEEWCAQEGYTIDPVTGGVLI